MATVRRKISELTALASASLDTTLLGVDSGTTYKIELDTLADAVTARVNILDRNRLSALETYTASFSASASGGTISSSAQISAFGFISSSHTDITSLNSFTSSQSALNTAFTNGISSRLTTSSFESFSSSVHSEIVAATNEQDLTPYVTNLVYGVLSQSVDSRIDNLELNSGSYLTSLDGAITSSSQLTSSYDSRYVISGSITQTNWDNINGKPSGLVSQSTDLTSLNTFTASISTASLVNRLNSIESVSGSWITESETGSFLTNLSGAISSSLQVVGILTSLNTFTASVSTASLVSSINNLNLYTSSQSTGSLVDRLNTIESVTSSYETKGRGTISGSSQLSGTIIPNLSGSFTGSFKGPLDGVAGYASTIATVTTNTTTDTTLYPMFSLNPSPNSYITPTTHPSGTFYYNGVTRKVYGESFVGTIEATNGVLSGSAQITTLGFISSSTPLTSLNAFTASVSTASLVSSINNLNSYTSSLKGAIELTGSTVSFLGNIVVYGTQSVISSTNVELSDNILYLSPTASTDNDLGIVGHYNDGTYRHAGIFMDASDGHSWKVFNGLQTETTATVDTSGTGFTLADFKAGTFTGTSFNGIINATNGVISGSSQIVGMLSSLNTYTASVSTASLVSAITNLNSFTSSNTNTSLNTFTGSVVLTSSFNSYTASQSTSSLVNRLNTIESVSGSWITESETGSFLTSLNGAISSSTQITAFGFISSSTPLTSLNTFTGSVLLTSSFNSYTASISTASLVSSITNLNNATSSYETTGRGIVSGSSQLTSSLDTRYAASGSVGGVAPAGTVSGSSQLTSSLDLRYLVTGSVTSSILQLNTFTGSVVLTSSFNTYTASISTASLATTASLNLFTSSINAFSASEISKSVSLSTYTASLNIWTSSVATTGSNSFNGNQTVTGSLTVSSVAVISSSFTANSSSLTLNSGSNFYLQNNGIAEISGSLRVSGSLALTGSISISSGSITMQNRPAFRVYGLGGATAAVTTLSGSMTIVDYNQGGWDNTTGTFTAPIAGLYQVNLVCRTNSNSSPSGQIIVYKNNTGGTTGTPQIMIEWAANTTMNHAGGSTISKLAVGDTLKAVVAVGTLSFDANDNFSVAYIG